jgi:hypothetical protein
MQISKERVRQLLLLPKLTLARNLDDRVPWKPVSRDRGTSDALNRVSDDCPFSPVEI